MSQPPKSNPPPRNKQKRPPDEPPKKSKSLLIWAVLLLVFLMSAQFFAQGANKDVFISYSQFQQYLQTENIEEVTITDKQIAGRLKQSSTTVVEGVTKSFRDFNVFIPFDDPDLVKELMAKGVMVTAQPQTTNWVGYLIAALPWLLLIGFWVFILRQMQSGQRGMFSFGKSRAKMIVDDGPSVTFEDVAGVQEAKRDLQEIVGFLKNPEKSF